MTKDEIQTAKQEYLIELRYAEKSKKTLDQYDRVLSSLINYLVDDKEFTKDDLIRYKSDIVDVYDTATINNYLTIINLFLKYLNMESMCIRKIKTQQAQSLKNLLTVEDYKRLLRWAKRLGYADIYMLMKTLAETGARIEEIKFITVEALKTNYIKADNKGKRRNLIIRNDLKRELKKYCRENAIKQGYVFRARRKKENLISKQTVWHNMQKIAGAAKVNKSKVHAHSFRHLFAVDWITNGGAISELSDILGHTKVDTTTIYTRTTDEMKRKKMEQMKV